MYYQRRASKYGNKKQVFNNRKYDSKLEAKYAQELDLMLKSGEVIEVIPQYKIELKVYDKRIGNYFVDFKVVFKDEHIEYWEIKGYATEMWRWKWKHAEAQLNVEEPDSLLVVYKQ